MSEYKPAIPISLNTAWGVVDILEWMDEHPMMTNEQKWKLSGMRAEIWDGVNDLYKEREDQSMYFKAIVDDMVDDISAMLEHQYNVRDLVELNEKQLEKAFWETIKGGYLKDIEPDKLVCLEKRPGKAPRVRLVGNDEESIREVIGTNYSTFKRVKGVGVCRPVPMQGTSVKLFVGMRDSGLTSLTEQQVQKILDEWRRME